MKWFAYISGLVGALGLGAIALIPGAAAIINVVANFLAPIAKGLGEFEKEATGIGKIAIQLQTPGAVMGVAGAGGAAAGYALGGDEPGMGAAKGAAAGLGIVLTPRMLGNILVNPSLLKHFRTGVWEYRQLGTPGPTLRTVLRQAAAQGAGQMMPDIPSRIPSEKNISVLPQPSSQPTPALPLP